MNAIQPNGGRLDALRESRRQALADIATGGALSDALTLLVLAAERHTDTEMLASVLLLDDAGKRLILGAAPSLPSAYSAAIQGAEIGPAVGSCGTAAFYGEAVFVDDIKTDPLWVDFREAALAGGLRACWSTPIKDNEGRVLGAFANYYREPRHPRAHDFEAIAFLAETTAQVIVDARARDAAL